MAGAADAAVAATAMRVPTRPRKYLDCARIK
jgi:hypothetical protein